MKYYKREIIFLDPEIVEPALMYQYGSIPVDIPLPSVPYEVLEDLYLDETNPFLFIKTHQLTGNLDKIDRIIGDGIPEDVVEEFTPTGFDEFPCVIDESLEVPDCDEGCTVVLEMEVIGPFEFDCFWSCHCPPVFTFEENDCGCPIPNNPNIPAGCVQVENDFQNDEPVRLVKVAIWDWVWIFKNSNITRTDRNGCWEVRRRYKELNVKVIFENINLKVRVVKYWGALRVLRDHTQSFDDPPYNDILTLYLENGNRREWAAAHTMNTDLEYRDNALVDNIQQPRMRINYTLHDLDLPGSAPMLQGQNWPFSFNILNAFGWTANPFLSDPSVLSDITNSYDDDGFLGAAARFNDTGFHELGHASHYRLAGELYWIKFRTHVLNNGGDGTFGNFESGSHPEIVALGEAIAEYTEEIYGPNPQGDVGIFATWRSDYIPAGMLLDLEGFSRQMLFNALNPNIKSIRDYRDNLSNLHLTDTPNNETDYNNLVNIYDVFN